MLAALLLSLAFAGDPMPDWSAPLALVALDGKPLPSATLAGKPVLFVNVASKCGYTPQYAGLEKVWTEYKDRGLVVVGVPSNEFGGQEPGTAAEIQSFCSLTYGVDFPMLEKQQVNGAHRSPLYQKLVGTGPDIKWNFEKILVGRDGTVLGRFPSNVTPDAPALRAAIETALAGNE